MISPHVQDNFRCASNFPDPPPRRAHFFLAGGYWRSVAPGTVGLSVPVPALLPARDGGLWVETSLGLLRYQDGRTNWFTEADGKSLRDVRTIAEATNGTVWFGTAGSGLACLEKNHVRTFSVTNGLPNERIECLRLEADGALWIGSFGDGRCRYKDGKFSTIDRAQGLRSEERRVGKEC